MSFQRHFLRSETWFISEENAVKYADNPDDNYNELALNLHDSFEVPRKNGTKLSMIQIQFVKL